MDQGGTFTDVVRRYADGRLEVEKVLTDTADLIALAQGADHVRGDPVAAPQAQAQHTKTT